MVATGAVIALLVAAPVALGSATVTIVQGETIREARPSESAGKSQRLEFAEIGDMSGLPGIVDEETLQGTADRHERMTIGVRLQGTGPYNFLIDTGSQRTILSRALAGSLGLDAGPEVRVMGMAGINDVGTAKIDTLDVGKRSFHDFEAPLLEGHDIGADGIIGTDNLRDQRILFDFDANTVAIGDASELGPRSDYEIVVRARSRSGRLVMTRARIDGVSVDVVIDTGSSGTVGNRALQRALVRNSGDFQATLYSVTGHEIIADMGIARELRIATAGISNIVIAFADAPAFKELELERRPAIFLGMRELRAFKRVAIDFPRRQVLFDLPG